MSLLHSSTAAMLQLRSFRPASLFPSSPNKFLKKQRGSRTGVGFQLCFNPFEDQPILKEALKEPVAFMGGVFAGLLRLDLNEEPLKEWITKTVEASGMTSEELDSAGESKMRGGGDDEVPLQIEIE